MGVEFWDLDRSSTGQDLVALLTDEEAACVEDELGANYQAMLEAPLLQEGDGSSLAQCLTAEHAVSASLSMLSIAAGGFSAGTQECITGILRENPAAVEALDRQGESTAERQCSVSSHASHRKRQLP